MSVPNVRQVQGYCSLCIARCGTMATVEDGRFTRLDPDPSHPTGAAICAKGRAAPELVYHKDRLTRPLRRTRPKGDADPGWEEISWDEALDATAAAMRRIADQHGPQAVAFSQSSPSTTAIGGFRGFIARLMNAFGTPNMVSALDLCGWGRGFATRYAYGVGSVGTGGAGGAMADIAQSGCLILWGYNPSYLPPDACDRDGRGAEARHEADRDRSAPCRPGQQGRYLAARAARHRRGAGARPRQSHDPARLVRPRLHPRLEQRAAAGARRYRRLLREERPDAGRRRATVSSPGTRARHARSSYDPATGRYDGARRRLALDGEYRVATPSGTIDLPPGLRPLRRAVPTAIRRRWWRRPAGFRRAQLEETARLIWHARPVSYYAWSGHEHHANTTETARAMALLYALTGSFDAPGGNVLLPGGARGADHRRGPAGREAAGPRDRRRRTPARAGALEQRLAAQDFYRAVLEGTPYPVRGLIGFGANLLLAHADPVRGRAALAALDFYAHADLFMNPTAALADIVLPVASCLRARGAEDRLRDQRRGAVAGPAPPGRRAAAGRGAAGHRHRLRSRRAARAWRASSGTATSRPPIATSSAPSGVTLEQLRAQPDGVRVPLQTRHAKHAEPDAHGPSARLRRRRRARSSSGRRRSWSTATRRCPSSSSRRSAPWPGPTWPRATRWC